MITAIALSLAAVGAVTVIGAGWARLLLPRATPASAFAAPLVGLAVVLWTLELAGLLLPVRHAVWVLVPVAAAGYAAARWSRSPPLAGGGDAALVLVAGLAVGLVPVAIAGRLTSIAMTNDDATFYITVADRLRDHAWSDVEEGFEGCLRARMLHAWHWRTGVPNLLGAVSATFGVDVPRAVGVVTALLAAMVPPAAVVVAGALGPPLGRTRRLGVALLAGVGAAPVFLAYQHLLGQLAATTLFPLACLASVSAVDRGGARALALAGVALGASVAVFADASTILAVTALAALAVPLRRLPDAVLRLVQVGLATIVLYPATIVRAALAAVGTFISPMKSALASFPQRGWLARSPLDDAATVVGVDPWPPWPSPSNALGVVELLATAAGLLLLGGVVWRARDRSRALAVASLLAAMVAFAFLRGSPRYLVVKLLLVVGAFVVPACARGALTARTQLERVARTVYVLGIGVAFAALARPSGFHVVDEPEHDRIVPELARLEAGRLLALDGLGSPFDPVHDEHRAYRAALLAHLRPIQPGLDGGYYRKRCTDLPDPEPLPSRGYALQSRRAETISRGPVVATWGSFVLREVDFSARDALLGAWAPTRGWLRAEAEPDGTVFRWGSADAAVEARFVQRAPCARVRAEARTLRGGELVVGVAGSDPFRFAMGPAWRSIELGPVVARGPRSFAFNVENGSGADRDRAFVLRRLEVVPDEACVRDVVRMRRASPPAPLPEALDEPRSYAVHPAAGASCGDVAVEVDAAGPGKVTIAVGGRDREVTVSKGRAVVRSPRIDVATTREVVVTAKPEDEDPRGWRVLGIRVEPRSCLGGDPG